MRITTVSHPELVNCNYRSYQPLMALARQRRHEIHVNRRGEPRFSTARVLKSDVLHIHRFSDREILDVVRLSRGRGIAVVWDNDDDETAVPKSSRHYRTKGGLNGTRTRAEIKEMLGLAHAVTTPSDVLAEQYRSMGATNVHVLENYVGDHYLLEKPRPHTGIVVGWLAGREHHVDYDHLRLREAFERLLQTHADVRIVSIGLALGLRSDRYRHIPILRWLTELGPALAEFDIGLAPLADIPFNRARSNIKLKEYAAVGVPWLASPIGPYRAMGEKQGGRLVGDDRWYDELDRLIRDERARRKLAKRGSKWARGEAIGKNVHRWMEVFEDAVGRARRDAG